jgi:general secretion pathway protein L
MLRDFLLWWFGQLAELLPPALRRSSPAAADATVITPIGDAGQAIEAVAVSVRRNGKETPLSRFALGTTGLADIRSTGGKPTVLRLREWDVLGKTVTLPIAAERELGQALEFEMDRETPFAVDEIYWNHRIEAADRENGRLSARLVLVPKARLDPLLGALGQIGLAPRRAEVVDGPDAGFWLPLDGNGGRVRHASNRWIRPVAACCAVLALAAIVTPFVRQAVALAALDRELAQGRNAAAEADGLRRQIEQLAGSANIVESEQDKAGRPLAVLAATTRVLPDDTYLTEMELRQRKLTLSGRSAAAARLIGAFAAEDEFSNPAFAAPVTRIEALRMEIFTIIAEVAP